MSKKLTLKHAQGLAQQKDGECISCVYINNYTYLMWKCKNGHTWESPYYNIQKGRWCPYCIKLDLDECIKWATLKGGKCLSKDYVNNHTLMLWQCRNNHIWRASFHNIKDGECWCRACNTNTIKDCIMIHKR